MPLVSALSHHDAPADAAAIVYEFQFRLLLEQALHALRFLSECCAHKERSNKVDEEYLDQFGLPGFGGAGRVISAGAVASASEMALSACALTEVGSSKLI